MLEWIKKLCYICTRKYYTEMRMDKIVTCNMHESHRVNIMLAEEARSKE